MKPDTPPLPPHLFQQAVEQADMAISITDQDANILYVNPAFCRATGYEAAEVIGRNQSILSNKTTPAKVYQALWQTIARGESWSGRLVNRRRDGGKYLADLLVTPVADAAGAITHYLGLHRDVTELHRLECEARNQKALIESAVDAAPIAMALVDADDCVVLDNHEYKKLMGDLGMVEPASVLLAALRAELGHAFGTPRAGNVAFLEREVRVDRAGWKMPRWFSCSGTWVSRVEGEADAFFDRRHPVYLLLVASETTAQRAEQEKARLAALKAVMAEEARVGGLRESLSAAVFQLEGPLNLMNSVLATISRRGCCEPAGETLVEAVNAGRAALETLRGAVPAPRRETPTSVNLNELLHDVIELSTGRLLAAGITVSWQPQPVLPAMPGCPNQLRGLFKALVDNAIEAMNTRGWRERELVIATRTVDDALEVIVEDSGPGIPAGQRLKVFEPFFSTKKGGEHPGTGLSMALQAAVDHGGGIELDPAARGGCRVCVVLPLRGIDGERA